MILGIVLATALACSRGDPTSTLPSVGVRTVEVAPPSTSLWVAGTMQFSATPKDSTGAVVENREVAWSSSATAVASVNSSGLVTAHAPGAATITAASEGRLGTAVVTVAAVPGPGLGVPVYAAGNAQHVLHVFEDWSTYGSIAAIATTSRVDGGGPWQSSTPEFKTFSTAVDPWFGRRAVTIDLQAAPGASQALTRGFHLGQSGTGPARFLNAATAQASLVIEWAVRQTGTGIYLGKQLDWTPGGSLYRFNFQNSWDRLGDRANPTCDGDPLCNYYYANNGQTPRAAGTPPSAGMFGDQFARSFTEGGATRVHHWNQNRNWGTGAGRFDPAVTTVNGRRVSPFLDNVWRRYIIRLTLNQPGQLPGHGRVEQWIQRAGEPMVKVMDYMGDVGTPHQGLIHTGPSTGQWLGTGSAFGWYDLTAVGPIYQGGNTLTLGYFRMWSHPREALP